MSFVEAFKTEELANGEMRSKVLSGKSVAVAHVGDSFFAFDDTCTHRQCSLSEGFLEDGVVECPCHGGKFNIKTGEILAMPPVVPLPVYPVKVENGIIYVEVSFS